MTNEKFTSQKAMTCPTFQLSLVKLRKHCTKETPTLLPISFSIQTALNQRRCWYALRRKIISYFLPGVADTERFKYEHGSISDSPFDAHPDMILIYLPIPDQSILFLIKSRSPLEKCGKFTAKNQRLTAFRYFPAILKICSIYLIPN
jgi:hypothetical protein